MSVSLVMKKEKERFDRIPTDMGYCTMTLVIYCRFFHCDECATSSDLSTYGTILC